MIKNEFQEILTKVIDLDHDQRITLRQELDKLPAEQMIFDLLEERIERMGTCVHCGSSEIIKKGKQSGLRRYHCKSCKTSFNAATGTPFSKLRLKGKWMSYLSCILDSKTIRKSAADVGINPKTAFRWRHRFMNQSHGLEPMVLSGIVEADETYFRKSMKGSRKLTRPPRPRGSFKSKRGLSKELVSVMTLCDRVGGESDFITGLGPVKSRWLERNLTPHLEKDVLLITDKAKSYKCFCKKQGINQVRILSKTRVRGSYHIQHVNSYHSTLKQWIKRFNGVATKYLNTYLGWSHELFKVKCMTPKELFRFLFELKELEKGT